MAKKPPKVDKETGKLIKYVKPHNKYTPEVLNQIYSTMANGKSLQRALINAGISYECHRKWLVDIPEYKEFQEHCKTAYEAAIMDLLHDGAKGEIKGYNATASLGLANNGVEGFNKSQGGGNTYNIDASTTNNNLSVLSEKEIDTKIKSLLDQLPIEENIIDVNLTNDE